MVLGDDVAVGVEDAVEVGEADVAGGPGVPVEAAVVAGAGRGVPVCVPGPAAVDGPADRPNCWGGRALAASVTPDGLDAAVPAGTRSAPAEVVSDVGDAPIAGSVDWVGPDPAAPPGPAATIPGAPAGVPTCGSWVDVVAVVAAGSALDGAGAPGPTQPARKATSRPPPSSPGTATSARRRR